MAKRKVEKVTEVVEGPQNLNLVVTEERVKDMDLETFYHIEDKSPKVMVDFVAHFVCDDKDKYVDKSEAVQRVLKGRKMRDVEDIMVQLNDAMEEMAVPNP